MAIRTHDTNPSISNGIIREILAIENDLDKHLLNHLFCGKASYLVTASEKKVVDILMDRYKKVGWQVKLAYSGSHLYRLEFEDPDQLEITRKLKRVPG